MTALGDGNDLPGAASATRSSQSAARRWPIRVVAPPAIPGILALIGLAIMFGLGERMIVVNAPLIDAAMEIKYETTLFRSAFERTLAARGIGAEEPPRAELWRHLDTARWYTRAMLDGGRNDEGTFLPLEEFDQRLAIQRAEDALARLRDIAASLLNATPDAPAIAAERRRFAMAIRTAQANADAVETAVQDGIAAQKKRYAAMTGALGVLMAASTLLGMVVLARLDRQRQEAEDDLRRSNADLERFAHMAAHDLKEPVRAMAGYSRLLRLKHAEALPTEGREYLGFIEGASHRLQKMIGHLLDLAKLSSDATPFGRVDTGMIFEAARQNLRERIAETGAGVSLHGTPPTVMGNEGQLTVLFQNLINNALKYQPDGNVPMIELTVHAIDDGDSPDGIGPAWLFTLRDNGIGIPPDEAERVFLYFRRLHDDTCYAGTGLGLAVCRRIVEHHGGHIWVETKDTPGATVQFTLPRIAD